MIVKPGWMTALLLAIAPRAAPAQSLASPFGTVSQRVDSTTITVEYYRPSARGRTIFGSLVRWGSLWTPGANWATTLEVDRDVRIEDRPLSHGKYAMWLIPAESPDSWTVVLNRASRRFHVTRPDPAEDQLRFPVLPQPASHFEVLTFSFPDVSRSGATLAFHWAETMIPMRIGIESTRRAIAAAHPGSSYAGIYELRPAGDSAAAPVRYEIVDRADGLWVRTAAEAVEEGLDPEFDLVPMGGDEFHPRQYKNGRLIGTELDEVISFQMVGNQATAFELRGIAEDKVLARAVRTRP